MFCCRWTGSQWKDWITPSWWPRYRRVKTHSGTATTFRTSPLTHITIGESVVQSKSTHSQRPKLSMIECGHQMDGWLLCARLCTHPEVSLEIMCRLYKRPSDETINQGPLPKDQICTLKILKSMSEFSGLWKQQYKPACTKSVRVFIMLKLDTVQKKKKNSLKMRCFGPRWSLQKQHFKI